jgi:hypothetical protein
VSDAARRCDQVSAMIFAMSLDHRLCVPALDYTLELEVRFCVRGVISPLLANFDVEMREAGMVMLT